MLRLSKKADYALLAMRHLASNADRGAVSARELAEAYDLPPELLAKVLQKLVRGPAADVDSGHPRRLRAGPARGVISVADVIQAVDGPLTVTACTETEPQLRPVPEVQHPRSALADQGPDRVGAGGDVHGRTGGRLAPLSARRPPAAGVPVPYRGSMITVTDNAASQISKLIRKQHRRGDRPPRGREGGRLFRLRVRLRVGAGAARRRPRVRRARMASASGLIRAAIVCSTARRSTTTRV